LGHFAGVEHVSSARKTVEAEIKKARFNSSHLVDFAREGRIDKLLEELQNFADPDSMRDGVPALLAATQGKQLKCIELLLDYGPSRQVHQNALLEAARAKGGDWKFVEALFTFIPDDDVLREVLNHAVSRGDLKFLEKAMSHKPPQLLMDTLVVAIQLSQWRCAEYCLRLIPRLTHDAKYHMQSGVLAPIIQGGDSKCFEMMLSRVPDFERESLFSSSMSIAQLERIFYLQDNWKNLVFAIVPREYLQFLETHVLRANRPIVVLSFHYIDFEINDPLWIQFAEALAHSKVQTFTYNEVVIPVAQLQQDLAFAVTSSDPHIITLFGTMLSALKREVTVTVSKPGGMHDLSKTVANAAQILALPKGVLKFTKLKKGLFGR
jgi:hypothetical protein